MRIRSVFSAATLGAAAILLAACAQTGNEVAYAPNDCAYFENNYGAHQATDHFSLGSPVKKEGTMLYCDMGGQ